MKSCNVRFNICSFCNIFYLIFFNCKIFVLNWSIIIIIRYFVLICYNIVIIEKENCFFEYYDDVLCLICVVIKNIF